MRQACESHSENSTCLLTNKQTNLTHRSQQVYMNMKSIILFFIIIIIKQNSIPWNLTTHSEYE